MSQFDEAKYISELNDSFPKLSQPHQEYVLGIMRALLFSQRNDDETISPSNGETEKESGG